jgi:DNA-binding PadR family transcriptional regulator
MHRHHHHHHHAHWEQLFGGPRKGFGRGRFGGWFADGGDLGGRGFGMGRKLASGDLQLLILELLAEKPRHGYEIIKALEERSKGFYVPSPGMVYPALTYLEEIGHATVETEGTRKLYRLTDLGRSYLEDHRAETDALLAQFSRIGERLEHMRRIMRSARGDEDESGEAGWSKALIRARHALKSAVAETWNASAEEQERVADILKRAAQEIAAKEPRK